ncbi:MAG: hypothetical protein JOZ44_14160 [Acidobacteria bacterium]|nr:hypothetical protein [Acidobacteriota bacterium]
MRGFSKILRAFFVLCSFSLLLLIAGCAAKKPDLSRALHSEVSAPDGSPQIIAAYQPWFGRSGHMNVGYSSQDTAVLTQQVEHAKDLNIKAFVVNWYGPSHDFEDHSYALLQKVAAEHDFKTAIMYDESVDDPTQSTQQAIADLQYAYDHYIGPKASAPSNAYLTYDGRPMVFIFPKSGKTDWKQVKQALGGWEQPPELIYEDQDPRDWGAFDGYYAWVSPGKKGWARDGSNWGRSYLEDFYSRLSKEPNKIAVGAAWPGFDDSKAEWGQGRKIDYRCGKTLEDSLNLYRRYFPADHPLPFLMIVTWNDYEEGTAIERGLASCGMKTEPSTGPISAGQ